MGRGKGTSKVRRSRYDEGWKEVINSFFREFLEFFFPRIASHIDFSKGYSFLDKELARISRKGFSGRRVDKLVRVHRKDGKDQWLLVHIEVQGYPQEEFAKRMYVYSYRIYDRYDRDVVSLAVLTDEDKTFRPEGYEFVFGDFELRMSFPAVKLMDYRGREEELEAGGNPFSVVVMAHLGSQQTKGEVAARYEVKRKLIRLLYRRGYSRDEVFGLYRFIDSVLRLPEGLEEKLEEEISLEEEVTDMPYITSAERIGMRKGRLEGMLEEARESVLEALEEKFGFVPADLEEVVKGQDDRKVLKRWHRLVIRADSLDEFRRQAGV